MANTSDIRNGAVILHKNKRMKVIEFQHVKPGKGGAFVRTKLKDIQSGKVIDETFNSGHKIELIRVEAKAMQFLYVDGDAYVFMDNETFDQITVSDDVVGESEKFLTEEVDYNITFYDEQIVGFELPKTMDLKVTLAPPEIKKATATSSLRPIELENGMTVNAPAFIKEGDIIKINTETSEYLERVKQ